MFSCVQAVPPVNASAKKASCIFYNYTVKDGFCTNIITSLYVFGNNYTLAYGEYQTAWLGRYIELFAIADKCKPLVRDVYCRYHFPPCDTSLDKPQLRKICRKTCEYLSLDLCKKEMIQIREAARKIPNFNYELINCSFYDIANGGDSPECYQYFFLPGAYSEVFYIFRYSGTPLIGPQMITF